MRIAFVTGSRSDWGMVAPLLHAASAREGITSLLVVIGAHLSRRHGHSIDAIREAGWRPAACIDACEPDDCPAAITRITGRLIAELAAALTELRPEWLVVAGDRYDAFAAATAATTLGLPLAHVAGGETDLATNYDGNLRNAMTKLAGLHFVSSDVARQRVLALGEEPWRVHVVGLPSLDGLKQRAAPVGSLVARNLVPQRPDDAAPLPFVLGSYFPVTLQTTASGRLFDVWLAALSHIDGRHKLIVTTNADAGSDGYQRTLRAWAAGRSDVTLAASLDTPLYLSALKHCDCYIGNSSSGVIESPVFGTPAVIVGTRQDGRPLADNVQRLTDPTVESLSAAVAAQMAHGRYDDVVSPFGDGRAAQRVCGLLSEYHGRADLMLKRLMTPALEVLA